MTPRSRWLAGFAVVAAAVSAGTPDAWIPVRWDGGPLEVAHRAKDKALADPAVRNAIAQWYDPATLSLLDGTPVNCVLLTLAGGSDAKVLADQQKLVTAYAGLVRKRGLAVLGLVYPGPEPAAVASEAAAAALDGLVLEGEFPAGFVDRLQAELRTAHSAALVIPVSSEAGPLRKSAFPILAVEGALPGIGAVEDGATASASAGLWIDSNMWMVRSLRLDVKPRPVWLTHRPRGGSAGAYAKSIVEAAATGCRWVITLDDTLRPALAKRDPQALGTWHGIGTLASFFGEPREWSDFVPFGTVGIILDAAGKNLANSEEFLNLIARRRIAYRILDRAALTADSLAGLRAVLAFDLIPPSAAERKLLRDFASKGGLILGGPAWGEAPKDQAYNVASIEQGEVAVYKENAPDPQSVARDLNDLLTTPDFGISFFSAASVLPVVTASATGDRMAIQLVNYTDAPTEPLTIWLTRKCTAARLYIPGQPPADAPFKNSGGRTQIVVAPFPVYTALVLTLEPR